MSRNVSIPIYELNLDGSIKPNPLFHRSWDKLHSRCIEYPYAASKLTTEKKILDVGTVKADKAWIEWLESLSQEVYATDFDEPAHTTFRKTKFVQGDVRKLPFADDFFDAIFAVSVIEHIGLHNPQVNSCEKPALSDIGDYEAVKELKRILKSGGKLIMTLPFGIQKGNILGGTTRNYTFDSLKKFDQLLQPDTIDYYEYQYLNQVKHYEEYQVDIKQKPLNLKSKLKDLIKEIAGLIKADNVNKSIDQNTITPDFFPDHYGVVTWRRIPAKDSRAIHYKHTEGVACGVWKKK